MHFNKKLILVFFIASFFFLAIIFLKNRQEKYSTDQKNTGYLANEQTTNNFLKEYFARGYFSQYKNKALTINSEKITNRTEFFELKFSTADAQIECWPEFTTDQKGNEFYYKDVFLDASNNMKNPLASAVSLSEFEKLSKNFDQEKYFFIVTQKAINPAIVNPAQKIIFLGCELN